MAKDWNNLECPKCGSINDYKITPTSNQRVCTCNVCGQFLGNKPKENVNLREYRMPFGKHKGEFIFEIQDKNYLQWILDNTNTSGNIRKAIEERIKFLF